MVVSGRKGEIAAETERLLADHDAMDLINNHFIPALDEVGVLFDRGKFFLPRSWPRPRPRAWASTPSSA